SGRTMIVITEIPYQVSKSKLASDIANGVKSGRFKGISDVRDESDRNGIRLVVELRRGENDQVVMNQLFKHTALQTSFGVQCIALTGGRPRTLKLPQLLLAYRDHRVEVIRRRALFLLERAEHKAHLLEGNLIALDAIDRIVELIRASQTVEEAREALIPEFGLTRIQSDNILQMRLQRLTGMERQKVRDDLQKTREEIVYHRDVLTKRELVIDIIREDIHELMDKFGDDRRTEIIDSVDDIAVADLIPEEQVVVTISHLGYIKRTPLSAYRSQGRGGKGISGGSTREGDFIKNLYVSSTHDYILLFSNRGRIYWLKVYDIPELRRTSKGRAIINLLPLENHERVLSSLQVREFDKSMVVFSTRKGVVKKTALEAFSRPKRTGIIAINIDPDDELVGVALAQEKEDVVLTTASGMAIRFSEGNVRAMGRAARGVKGISLGGDDQVVGMAVVREGGSLLTVCQHGYGKRTLFSEYRRQKRGGKGLIDIRTTERNGNVVTSLSVLSGDEVMLMTSGGMLVRIPVDPIRPIGRNTQGVRLIRVNEGDQVIGAELVQAEEEKDKAGGTQAPEPETPATEAVEEVDSDSGDASEGEDA
ncbi:MAG: DNA gyrase C-terminal beta-propeller domain-containing protein, partial [Planctomycetota bacterium]